MTALPNYTCYKIIDSFGIETPFEVLTVDIIEFDRNLEGFKKCYGTHGVLVNGEFDSFKVELANISGNWSEVAVSKAEAYQLVEKLNDSVQQINNFWDAITDDKQKYNLGNNIRKYNELNDLFLRYGVSIRRKIQWVIAGNKWNFVRENLKTA